MKTFASISLLVVGFSSLAAAQAPAMQARDLEARGEALAARHALLGAVRSAPEDPAAALDYAEFMDRYNDPETRGAYERALRVLQAPAQSESRRRVARRLVLLDLLEGDGSAAARHLALYREAGGNDWPAQLPSPSPAAEPKYTTEIPGPLRSFARMAALNPDIAPEELLAALARNVIISGYRASTGGELLEPTEFMKLILRYLSQARELSRLAGDQKVIRIETCDSPQTADLLRILGHRMRGGCGGEVVLETVNASRAFLSIDSGFPIAELEQALRTSRPFVYEYRPTRLPLLYGADYWLTAKEKQSGDFIDALLADPTLCRAYLGMSRLDTQTAEALRKATPLARLKAFAHVLDFFGGMFEIRNGKAAVPGGARSAPMWAELVGVSPDQGAAFFERLISKDDGWMASYFDALARAAGPLQDYFTEPQRMKRFYLAVRGRVTSPGPARPVFRSNTDMLLLTTRLWLEASGRPHIPGNLEVWKNLFLRSRQIAKHESRLARGAAAWKEPDDVIEGLFNICRRPTGNEPLKIFLALSDLDRGRSKPLEAATVERLARDWGIYAAQYPLFADSPAISDATIIQFLDTASAIGRIAGQPLKQNVAGTMQALVGLWEIFTRQGSIPEAEADRTLAALAARFAAIRGQRELFDAGRDGVQVLLRATGSPEGVSPQDRLLDLLSGTASTPDTETQAQIVQQMIRISEAQRLVSLKTLFDLADNLASVSRGEKLDPQLVGRLTSRIAEMQPPRANLSGVEKNALSFGYWPERHVEAERRLNLRAVIERAQGDAERLRDVRRLLTPFLRDTLVGLNYAYYAPPGAQVLLTNPSFVRSHDFIGIPGLNQTWRYTELFGSGWPSSAGGRLTGSLAGLPYALAGAEQNFMIPEREQALIWEDLAPQLMVSAKLPRWWNVTAAQMHWVGLHMRYGEALVAEAALDPRLRQQVLAVLSRHAAPGQVGKVSELLEQGDAHAALQRITPSELFLIAQDASGRSGEASDLGAEIRRWRERDPERLSDQAISRAFGTPKPTLTTSYRPELLYLRTLPTLMGYSSRIMAESWESPTLYWAAVADGIHARPTQLNVLVPQWTERTLERIFATHLEDWPAVLRALRGVGQEVRLSPRAQTEAEQKASLP